MRHFPLQYRDRFRVFRKLTTPERIQDFLDSIPINFEKDGDSCRSPGEVLKRQEAHCMEGAMLAAAALWFHGEQPLLLDLKTSAKDDDHVVALFKRDGLWGAISKTNHAVLRYRDPVHKTIRELAMSYFSEYFLDSGKKTLIRYSRPFSLLPYEDSWLVDEENLWGIHDDLDDSMHYPIAPGRVLKKLRRADPVQIEAGKITEWKK